MLGESHMTSIQAHVKLLILFCLHSTSNLPDWGHSSHHSESFVDLLYQYACMCPSLWCAFSAC